MQKKIEIIAKNTEEAMAEAVKKLHISSDNIFINVLGELEEGLNCEALVDINLTLEGKRYLEGILKALNIVYQIEARSVNGEEQIHYIIESYENSATKTAKEVAKTKVAVKLQPMNSFERRVIHEKLSDWRDVYTESEGEGENRAIVIKPKNN